MKQKLFTNGSVFVSILILVSISTFASIDLTHDTTVVVSYSFAEPMVKTVEINRTLYAHVSILNLATGGNSGEPSLPIKGAYILLPQNTQVKEIEVVTSQAISLGTGFVVEPCSKPVPLSKNMSAPLPTSNKTIYGSSQPFPRSSYTLIGTYQFRGYTILVLALHPVQYIPTTGELLYYPQMTISVKTTCADTPNPLYRGLDRDKQLVMGRVDNPLLAETYNSPTQPPQTRFTQYTLLIITTDDFADSFQELADARNASGIPTIVKTIPYDSTPDDVRSLILTTYANNGIDYVLIGGDDDVIPVLIVYVEAAPGSGETAYMPSDIYYSCLDGTYNYDGDYLWGEPTDGPLGHDVDLVAEVYVGRACIGSDIEVDYTTSKTTAYTSSNGEYLNKALMVGEYLGFGGVADWGGNYKDEIIDGSTNHGYVTVGIPSEKYTIDTLYDRDWPGNDWPNTELIERINNGVHIINHLGHADYQYNMKLDIGDVTYLTNTNYCFIYSQGCNAGGFDNGECIAEYFTAKTAHAAFAGVWNARYGWGASDSTDGPSQRYDREFWDAVFSENKTQIGKANVDSKEDNLYRINEECMRWCYYELNLFGDPSISFKEALTNVTDHELCGEVYDGHGGPLIPGGPYTITCDVYVPYSEELTVNPGVSVDFNPWNVVIAEGTLDASGQPTLPVRFTLLGYGNGIKLYRGHLRLFYGGFLYLG